MRLCTALLALVLFGGCNFVESIKDTQAQADAAAAMLEKDVGTRPLIGWNVNNNTLTNVNVIFDGGRISAYSVADLESKVRKAVTASFKQQPKQLIVSAKWEG